MNYLVKPGGWTDADVVDGNVAAEHLNKLDANSSRSVDGDGGGKYSPAQPIHIDDIKTDNLQSSVLRGALTRTAGARWPKRVNDSVLFDTAAIQHLKTDYDIYWSNVAKTVPWTIYLDTLPPNAPSEGDVIEISITGAVQTVTIKSQTVASGNTIGVFPSSYSKQYGTTPLYAKCYFDGNAWYMVECSADVQEPP